ncbi:MAG: hypothetical protein AAF986_03410, partial [Pseudomonadota bacterium]
DYKLFRTPEAVTLNPYQTKQIAFLNVQGVELDKVYTFNMGLPDETRATQQREAIVRYDINNSRNGALARSLPAGTMRFSAPTSEGLSLHVAEGEAENLAVDVPVKIETAPSGAVVLEETVALVASRNGDLEKTFAVTAAVINTQNKAAIAEVRFEQMLRLLERGGWGIKSIDIISESHPRKTDTAFPTWRLKVPANDAETRRWQVRVQYR